VKAKRKLQSSEIFILPERTFTQDRSRRTYQALIEAAYHVFGDKGYDAAQTPDIAARAKVSVGTFYRYFNDKHEVFLEIMQMHLSAGQAEVMSKLDPAKLVGKQSRATIEHTLAVLLDRVTRFPALEQVFQSMSLRDPDVGRLRRRMEESSCRQIAQLLEVICSREVVPDPEAMAYVIHTAVVECAIHIAGFRGRNTLPRDRALHALTDMIYRALFAGTPDV